MSLLNQKNPFDTFAQCATRFIQSPEISVGIELDDAVVALKRHSRVVLNDEGLATQLEQLARPIRERDLDTLQPLFEEILATYNHLGE